jgi:hypothetical protein
LNEVLALTKSNGETLPWLECLPIGICDSKHMAQYLYRWVQRGDKAGEFMAERESEVLRGRHLDE